MLKWFAAEMHTHTVHSDGSFTVQSLCECAKRYELKMLALTDHNTVSSLRELTPELAERALPVIPGLEWTTYHGHMLILGCEIYVDWRDLTQSNFTQKLREIHMNKGIVGIAHPFAIGSPLCTGCSWDYEIDDWDLIDYIEVWSEAFPPTFRGRNERAEALWQRQLDLGHRLAATYGKDWHEESEEKTPWGCTYLAAERAGAAEGLDALRQGRTMVSMGPRPIAELCIDDRQIYPGDRVRSGAALHAAVGMDADERRGQWEKYGFVPQKVQLIGEGARILSETALNGFSTSELSLTVPQDRHFRLRYVGEVMGRALPLAFTSPYYTEPTEDD